MLPMKPIRLALGTLLAAQASTLAPATDPNVLALINAPFTATENLVAGDLSLADFTGSAPIEGVTGTQTTGIDPVTLAQVIEIVPPLGGYRWETTNTVNLPQTIYGYALLSNDLSTLLAVQEFATPITLQAADQFIDADSAILTFVQQPVM
jgi:hypothetical protein